MSRQTPTVSWSLPAINECITPRFVLILVANTAKPWVEPHTQIIISGKTGDGLVSKTTSSSRRRCARTAAAAEKQKVKWGLASSLALESHAHKDRKFMPEYSKHQTCELVLLES